eukprot:5483978-Prymnesium_polylepis.2
MRRPARTPGATNWCAATPPVRGRSAVRGGSWTTRNACNAFRIARRQSGSSCCCACGLGGSSR